MPTTNPVPSQDPSDLLFNAGVLDAAVNSSAATYQDRFGVTRMTVSGATSAILTDVATVESSKNTAVSNISADVATVESSKNTAIASIADDVAYVGGVADLIGMYVGASASDPTTRVGGGSLQNGDFYLNTGINRMKAYANGSWYATETLGATDAALVGYMPAGTGAVDTTVEEVLLETVSVINFGADKTGGLDSAEAFNKAWQHIKQSVQNMSPGGSLVSVSIVIPPGKYKASTSINWTNLVCWNIHIKAEGAVLISSAANKPAIDAIGVRGLHLNGLAIHGEASSPPSCAILIGPIGTATCGNNKFTEVKTTGVFTKAAFANIGSETTPHENCYYSNSSTDPAAYAFIGDGRNRFGFTSDYAAIRASGVAVSFTNNTFYSCHLRNYGGGNGTYIESAIGWSFDPGCYHLVFDGSNIVIRQDTEFRSSNMSIKGLFETRQGAGVKHCVKFILDNGSFSGLTGFEFVTGSPHAEDSIFIIENEFGAPVSSGFLKISNATIKVEGSTATPAAPLFSGAGLYIMGDVHVRNSPQLNISELNGFHGVIYTSNIRLASLPTSGDHSYIVFDESSLSGQVVRIGGTASGQVGLQGGALPTIRAEGENTDLDLKLQGKGNGLVRFGTSITTTDSPITGYIEIKDAGGTIRKLAVIS